MPAEPAEEILARAGDGELVSLGHVIRVSDGDVIFFDPARDEKGEIIWALSDHFYKQITYLDEDEIDSRPQRRTALMEIVQALQELFAYEDEVQARTAAISALAKEARLRGKGFSAAERDARIPQQPQVFDLGETLSAIRPHLPVLVKYLELY